MRHERRSSAYWNPYLAGFLLGLLLLTVFGLTGRGLGASGAYSALVAAAVETVAPDYARENSVHAAYLGEGGTSPLRDWLVLQLLGVAVGAFLSGRLAGRVKPELQRGPRSGRVRRLLYALAGGLLMGFAAKLARGCTSGLVLSGGALLGAGAWIFMLAVFAGGYAMAWFVRRQWT